MKMDVSNSSLDDKPHRVYAGAQVWDGYTFTMRDSGTSCWELADVVEEWLHQHARGSWYVWEDFRYHNNMDLYDDCDCMEDCHQHTRPFIAFQLAEDAMLFKLTW
jgi:hypothetical protein